MSNDGWVPGVDFDPHDPDEMEIMHVVWEQEKHDAMTALQRENDYLRQALARYEGDNDGP